MIRRILSALLCLCLLLTLQPGIRAAETGGEDLDFAPVEISPGDLTLPGPELPLDVQPQWEPAEDDPVKVIILMEEKSVLETDGEAIPDARTRKQMDALRSRQDQVLEAISREVCRGLELPVQYRYTWLLNGVATVVPYGSLDKIEQLQGVRRVLVQQVYTICETTGESEGGSLTGEDITGREDAWALGYTGKGMKIAVIDTGLDSDHPSFAPLPEDRLTETSAAPETVAAVLEHLNAYTRCPGLEVSQLYRSSKVAFGFNYCDNNTVIDHLDDKGSHGTHVAGVAAANREPEIRAAGVAPDAQLYIMKVFGVNGGAYTQDILAAMEDALLLEADVINLSLGAPAGFSSGDRTSQGDSLDEFYRLIGTTGTVLCVSAGNFRNSGYGNRWGTDANLSLYPDDGTVGAPGTYANTLTVAAAGNRQVFRLCALAGDLRVPYNDSVGYGLPGLHSLVGDYDVLAVPGTGEPADYEGIDAAGKIVLVARGGSSFLEKHRVAEASGAAGMLVYNNGDGEFAMDMSGTRCITPAAAISRSDGEKLLAALAANPQLRISFPEEPVAVVDPGSYAISEFSARGPAPDLKLTPDITAPGSNIYSTLDGGSYGLMSGTSMASPAMAGMAALVLQYLREVYSEDRTLTAVRGLLGSTALPVAGSGDLPASPRSQGAGMASVFRALTARCFLDVEGMDFPKAELGDDPEKTGVYGFRFRIRNLSGLDAYYDPSVIVMGEGTVQSMGQTFLAGKPVSLEAETGTQSAGFVLRHDVDDNAAVDSRDARRIWEAARGQRGAEENTAFRCDVDRDEAVTSEDVQAMLEALVGNTDGSVLESTVLKVPAGSAETVEISITLSENAQKDLDRAFPNGGYVEGYASLKALHRGGVDLSLPYLGFYGSWAQAPVLDTGSYWDLLNAPEGTVVGNQSIHLLLSGFGGKEKGIYPGMNPYLEGEPFSLDHICLSPNGDGNLDTISDICLSLLRNAAALNLRITNRDTGDVLWTAREYQISKSVYRENGGKVMPWSWDRDGTGSAFDFSGLENGTRLLLEVEAVGAAENDEPEIWSVPITIDLEAPQLLEVQRSVEEQTGKTLLHLRFRENLAAAALILADGAGERILSVESLGQPDDTGLYEKTVDITGLTGKITLILADYGANRSAYAVHLGGEVNWGRLLGFQRNFLTGTLGWVSFSRDVQQNEMPVYPAGETAAAAAEWADGFLYAQGEDGILRRLAGENLFRDGQVPEMETAARLERVYRDLTWDQSRGIFYGLYREENQTRIYVIRYLEAEQRWQEEPVTVREDIAGFCLAAAGENTLYLLGTYPDSREAVLFRLGLEPGTGEIVWEEAGSLGLTLQNPQSMTFDRETGTLLWARFDLERGKPQCQLVEITIGTDPEEPKIRVIGELSGQVLGLMIPDAED